MAIIEELGLEVKIIVEGEPAKEYMDTEPSLEGIKLGPDTRTSHCYIESREDIEFSIQIQVLPRVSSATHWIKPKTHCLCFYPSFDGGPYLDGLIVSQAGRTHTDCGIESEAKGTLRKFRFSSVSTVESEDNHRIAKDMEMAKHLGLLRVAVLRCIPGKAVGPLTGPVTSGLAETNLALAENALKGKALSLGATVSRSVQAKSSAEFVHVKLKDSYGAPYAIFCFKYRTREDLQKAMVIPRPQVSTTEPMADAVEDLSPKEALRLAGERLEMLPFEELLRLFGEGIKGLHLRRILQLSCERLENLPLRVVLRLAGEKLQELQVQDKGIANINSGDEEACRSMESPKTPDMRIKREGEQGPSSERPSKDKRTKGLKETIDLTEDFY